MRTTAWLPASGQLDVRMIVSPEPLITTNYQVATLPIIFRADGWQYALESRNRAASIEVLIGQQYVHALGDFLPLLDGHERWRAPLLALTGYSRAIAFNPADPDTARTIVRGVPLRCPFDPSMYCVRAELVQTGINDVVSYLPPHAGELTASRLPVPEWAIFRLQFANLPYRLDETRQSALQGPSTQTYISLRRSNTSRERRISGFGLEFERAPGVWATVPDETTFVPETTTRLSLTTYQIPESLATGYFWVLASELAGTVNETPVTLFGATFAPETLLYRGLSEEMERYVGADGAWYYDLTHIFEFRARGHNVYPTGTIDATGQIFYGRQRRRWPERTAAIPDADPPIFARENLALLLPRNLLFSPVV